jgi:hypothetical protein
MDLTLGECLAEQDRVGPNALFDVGHYRARYGAAMPRGMTCLEHFCAQERSAPRDPNTTFSVQQWHETIGWRFPDPGAWKRELFRGLGEQARFALAEMERHKAGQVVLQDDVMGDAPRAGETIGLFAHHDAADEVQDYVLDYMDALRAQGVRILLLTNSRALTDAARQRIARRVWRLVCTSNRAYDWGLYRIGVERIGQDQSLAGCPVLLTNDSVVGTMHALDPLFALARSGEADIVGAVDCWLHTWHLQSFFLHCSVETVRSRAWRQFWANYRPLQEKWFVINAHEFGFSRWMRENGVRMRAGWEYDRLLAARPGQASSAWRRELLANRGLTNPTVELWDLLLEQQFPFLKRTVFTQALQSGNLAEMCNVVSRLTRGRAEAHDVALTPAPPEAA